MNGRSDSLDIARGARFQPPSLSRDGLGARTPPVPLARAPYVSRPAQSMIGSAEKPT